MLSLFLSLSLSLLTHTNWQTHSPVSEGRADVKLINDHRSEADVCISWQGHFSGLSLDDCCHGLQKQLLKDRERERERESVCVRQTDRETVVCVRETLCVCEGETVCERGYVRDREHMWQRGYWRRDNEEWNGKQWGWSGEANEEFYGVQ